jgi:hypothetical protein
MGRRNRLRRDRWNEDRDRDYIEKGAPTLTQRLMFRGYATMSGTDLRTALKQTQKYRRP